MAGESLAVASATVPPTLAAVVFDWAGTVVDFGRHAQMGLPDWRHIQALGACLGWRLPGRLPMASPDNLVCAGDLPENRPSPTGRYRCFVDLQVWPAWRVLKVDDTVPGLLEGRHAGPPPLPGQ